MELATSRASEKEGRGAEVRRGQLGSAKNLTELAAILGEVDGLRRRADDGHPGVAKPLRKPQRGLPAELDDDAGDGARLALGVIDLHDVFEGQGLKVKTVGGVIVRRDGLRVAVHHDGLVTHSGEFECRVDTGVVELDPLANAVGPRTQDEHLLLLRLGCHLGLGGGVQLIGGVVVGGLGLELSGAGIHRLEDRADAQGPAQAADPVLPRKLGAKRGDLGVGQAVILGVAEEFSVEDGRALQDVAEVDEALELGEEPGVDAGSLVDLLDARPPTQRLLHVVHAALGGAAQCVEEFVDAALIVGDGPEAGRLLL